jgi:low density lipoprotein receptor-related protein 5/6
MYWTNAGSAKIQRANLDGSSVEDLVTTGLITPRGIALDIAAGKMYWTDTGTDKIQRANLDGSSVEDLVTGLSLLRGIALDLAAGKMYWTNAFFPGKIQRANFDGSSVEDLVTGLSFPFGIALDLAAGKMYWTDEGTNKIQRANLDGSSVENLVTGIEAPLGIALGVPVTAPDTNPPSCTVTQIIPGPPKQIRITIQDTQSGVASIVVVTATNATVSIPAFTGGTTSPVIVTATKTNQAQSSTVVLRVRDAAGNETLCDPVYTTISAQIPQSFGLGANYPNPFNPTTRITFNVANTETPTLVTITVYDVLGKEVTTLLNESMQPGQYYVDWDGTDMHGNVVTSGMYMYRMTAGNFVATRRMALMK